MRRKATREQADESYKESPDARFLHCVTMRAILQSHQALECTLRRPSYLVHTRGPALLLPTAAKRVVQFHNGQPLGELRLSELNLCIEVPRVAVEDFKVAGDTAIIADICEPNRVPRCSGQQFILRGELLIFPVGNQRV